MNVSLIVGYLVVAVAVARYATGELPDDNGGHVLAGALGLLWPFLLVGTVAALVVAAPLWLIGRIAQVGRK